MYIELSNIFKSFHHKRDEIEIFHKLNLSIKKGEFVSIIGPNGCGKTTLLNIIDGIDRNFKGERILRLSKNVDIPFSYMLQKDLLLPWRTVFENITVGLEIKKLVTKERINAAEQFLMDLGIFDLKHVYPSTLSGGERQKVALIRTFVLDAEVLLLDEPFSSVDYKSRLELQANLFEFTRKLMKTTILVTHDVDEAIALSDRVIVLGEKPTGVIKEITIEIPVNNRTPTKIRHDPQYAFYYQSLCELIGIRNES